MRRREFIAALGAAAWPLVTRAQQPDRMRRIGVLMASGENDPEAKAQLSGFTQRLAELGWIDGRNLRMDVRWAAGNVDRMRMFAKELVGLLRVPGERQCNCRSAQPSNELPPSNHEQIPTGHLSSRKRKLAHFRRLRRPDWWPSPTLVGCPVMAHNVDPAPQQIRRDRRSCGHAARAFEPSRLTPSRH